MGDSGGAQVGPESLLTALSEVVYCQRRGESQQVASAGEEFAELTGYDQTAAAELSWREDVVHPEDRERLDSLIEFSEGEQTTFEGVYRIERTDGEIRQVRERGRTAVTDGDRVVEGIIADVSGQNRLERYRQLVENVGDPMYVLDTTGRIKLVNRGLAEFLGHEKEQIEGKPTEEILSETVVSRAEEVIADLLSVDNGRQTVTWEVQMENAAGEMRPVQIRTGIIRDESGTYRGSAGVIRDVTDQKERERELERYETVIQAVGDPVYTLDAEGNFRFVNDAFERLFGYSTAEIEGKHASTVLNEEILERSRAHIAALLADETKQSAKFEIQPTTSDGEQVPCELQMALLPHEEGFRGTAGVVRDITERKQREQRLEQFTSVVSHDLRGPLSSLAARTELARQTGEAEHFEEMERAIERMDRLIDDLLTLARHGEVVGETREVSLRSLAQRAWSSLDTASANLEVVADWQFEADPGRLQEVFENLFQNSIEHGPNEDAEPPVVVRVGTLENSPGFFVADDGSGIDAEKREAVFEHGYTTDTDGTGFGLSIVDRIVTAHGWSVSVTESWAGGARFEIRTD